MNLNPEHLAEQMSMAHEMFRQMVAEYRDDALAWITIVHPDHATTIGLQGGQEIVPFLNALPGLADTLGANGAHALIVSTTAWVANPSDLGEHSGPRAAGEAGNPNVKSIAMTVMCMANGDRLSVATDYDPETGVLGDARIVEPGREGNITEAMNVAMLELLVSA